MGENQKKILQMLADGKISIDEAQRLLELVDSNSGGKAEGNAGRETKALPRYMHVIVEPKPGTSGDYERHGCHGPDFHGKVNIRVPFNLIRAGMKFATLMPSDTADHIDRAFKEKGLSFNIKKLKEEDMDELMAALQDSEINVDSDRELIRIYSE